MYKKKIHDDQIINTLNRDKARSNPELAQQPLTFLTLISIPIQIERYLQKQERGQSFLTRFVYILHENIYLNAQQASLLPWS